MLQKPTEQWTRERVLRWLEDIGMEKYNDKFKAVTGKVIIASSPHHPAELRCCRAVPNSTMLWYKDSS